MTRWHAVQREALAVGVDLDPDIGWWLRATPKESYGQPRRGAAEGH